MESLISVGELFFMLHSREIIENPQQPMFWQLFVKVLETKQVRKMPKLQGWPLLNWTSIWVLMH